jgi:hypothetical protein
MAQPMEVLSIAAKIYPLRIRDIFFWKKFGTFDTLFLVNAERLRNVFSKNLEFYATAVFLIGIFLALTTVRGVQRSAILFFLVFVLYYTFIHGIVFVPHRMRYVAVLKPFLVPFLSFGIISVCRYLLCRTGDHDAVSDSKNTF